MAYSKQTWDTTSYVNPTRMNHIEDGIEAVDSKIASIFTEVEGPISATKIGKGVIVSLNFGSMTLSGDGKTFTDLIPAGFRPGGSCVVTTKTFNGSDYVDCIINLGYDGTISITGDWGEAITGLQPQYTRNSYIVYRTL